jgi:hypothetical protein
MGTRVIVMKAVIAIILFAHNFFIILLLTLMLLRPKLKLTVLAITTTEYNVLAVAQHLAIEL